MGAEGLVMLLLLWGAERANSSSVLLRQALVETVRV
jgi:hypothetical protein